MKYFACVCLMLFVVSASCSEQGDDRSVHTPSTPSASERHADGAVVMPVMFNAQAGAADATDIPGDVQTLFGKYCTECHGTERQKADVRLDNLATQTAEDRDDLLNLALDVLHFEQMPPADKPQPTEAELTVLMRWIEAQVDPEAAAALTDKLRYPHYGNVVDHEKLFSGEVTQKPYTPARRWLVSPQIFHDRVMDVFELGERDRANMRGRNFHGVTNPFVLPDHSGVRDYDIGILSGGHLLVMMTNARWIAEGQLFAARRELGAVDEAEQRRRFQWRPTTHEAFKVVLTKEGAPTDEELITAIQTQFGLVLGREASDAEVGKYLKLTRTAVDMAGNGPGLEQMLVTVLLESEFLYRMELGAGEEDAYGRQMLSPHEAAYAISYALGDRGPDAELIKAAEEGRLNTRADYRREVERLLADPNYYRGQIDYSISGPHYRSNETSHPRVVRFFREFFGYAAASKVFKDEPRSGGVYRNPARGTAGTPGRLILETDRIVTMFVEQDEDVFENLLTSDQFFVYHDRDNEKGQEIHAEYRAVWERLKDTEWRTNPEAVIREHLDFLKEQKSLGIKDDASPGILVNFMHYFEESIGQGRMPYTTHPWAHGYYWHHSPLYNLPPTPSTGRYGSWKSTEYKDDLEPTEFWDYPAVQPFTIEKRKGILTHPSWLIAHSTNFHTDPIRRGRWIQEKLLAGRVPDVPITVDAQVPEDPHKTFRERVEMVTTAPECWNCHQKMNPLGLPFEIYDDFGRFRTEEPMEHPDNLISRGNGKTTFDVYPTEPIVSTGRLDGTGDSSLDGEVDDALDLIDRLARSDRARQSIIRHAFRFFMGRNELLSDSQTLIDADRAYLESGGSFKAVIVSLLTSDSFLYRKEIKD